MTDKPILMSGPGDARAEGIGYTQYPIAEFSSLWDSLNGDKPGHAWRDNPWVVAVTFEPEHCNINQARKPPKEEDHG